MIPPKDPKTPREWQEAATLAHHCLCLDAARQFGLVAGGPEVDAGRCLDILRAAKSRGIFPDKSSEELGRFIDAIDNRDG